MCCGKGIVKTVAHGAIGLSKVALRIDIAEPSLITKRRDVCRKCPCSSKNPNVKFAKNNGLTNWSTCSKCKCNIAAKSQLTTEDCCDGRWIFELL